MIQSADARFRSKHGDFAISAFDVGEGKTHVALWIGELSGEGPLLTRIQSKCTTGTAFAALICDCGEQVQMALSTIGGSGRGLFVYLDAVEILHRLEASPAITLMTNNPRKVDALEQNGFVVTREPLEAQPTEYTAAYLSTKKHELGHQISVVE